MVNFKVGQLVTRVTRSRWWETHGGNYTNVYEIVFSDLSLDLKNINTGCTILNASNLYTDYEIVDTELLKVKLW